MYTETFKCHAAAALSVALLLFTTHADAQQDISGWPEWLQTAMVQENEDVKPKKHDFADDASVELIGEVVESQAVENGWYFHSGIGDGGSIECFVFTNQPELAATTMLLGDNNIGAMSDAYGVVENKALYHLDAGNIDGSPYFALEWVYTVGEAPDAKAGMTKVRAAVNGEFVQTCTHNGLGYRETLDRAFRAFVASLDHPRDWASPYYREVVRMDFGEQPVGLVWLSYTLDADGDTEIRSRDAQLIPVDAATVQSGDTVSTAYSYPDGKLINKSLGVVENGELVTFLELFRDDENGWTVSGTFQGKELETTLDGDVEPMSELGQQFGAEDLMAGEAEAVTLPIWIPEADPTSFLMATLERIDGDGRNNARVVMGPISMDVELDKSGSAKSGSMQIGAAVVTMERVFVDGKAR